MLILSKSSPNDFHAFALENRQAPYEDGKGVFASAP